MQVSREYPERVSTLQYELQQHYATKHDLSQLEMRLRDRNEGQFRWLVGLLLVIAAAVVTGMGAIVVTISRIATAG